MQLILRELRRESNIMDRHNQIALDPLTGVTKQPEPRGPNGGARILFLYPNERGMSTIPAAITILSQLLKDAGHTTALFDTTFYKFDDEIAIEDFDATFTKSLNYKPVTDPGDEDRYYKKTTGSAVEDFRSQIETFGPDRSRCLQQKQLSSAR